MKVLFLSADGYEDTELLVPYYRFLEEGVEIDIAAPKKGPIKGKHGYEVEANESLSHVKPDDYDVLVLPGGRAPAAVRKELKAAEIAKDFFAKDKPVAAICHGPQILITAGLLKGRHVTCYSSVVDEVKKAGAIYEDKEAVVDGNLVTSRSPADLPAFLRETMKKIRQVTAKKKAA
jgi:protease I